MYSTLLVMINAIEKKKKKKKKKTKKEKGR